MSKASWLNHSFHSRHSGIVCFSSPAGTDSAGGRGEEEEEEIRNASALCQFLIRTHLSSPHKMIYLIASAAISLPHPAAVLHRITTAESDPNY